MKNPELVRELNTLITKFLADTEAVVPIRNPSYKPGEVMRTQCQSSGRQRPAPRLEGAPGCEAVAERMRIVMMTRQRGRAVPRRRSGNRRSSEKLVSEFGPPWAAAGKAEWIPNGGNAQSVHFQISAGDWQVIRADIPTTGPLGIFRLYLPAQSAPVEIDHVELKGSEKSRKWDF